MKKIETVEQAFTPVRIEIIEAMAEQSLNISDVARAVYLDRNTVRYHLSIIEVMTGIDPKSFYGLEKLLTMVRKRK